MTNYDEYDTYWQNGGYKKISDVIFAEWHFFIFLFFGYGVQGSIRGGCVSL